jgi:hypothetical protein
MPDIALLGDRTFLFEKLFQELGASYQFIVPGILGSPFLPPFKVVIIPTGFANPQYSRTLPALQRARSAIEAFIRKGGILTVFGPLVPEHKYEWLPLKLEYICEYGSRQLDPSEHECSCLACTQTPECDGYLIPGERFETILKDEKGRTVLAAAALGGGMIVATSIHEFPAAGYIKWALSKAKETKI